MNEAAMTSPFHSPPRYCTRDRFVLMSEEHLVSDRYDAFTGQHQPVTILMLKCEKENHDLWYLRSDGTKWIKER